MLLHYLKFILGRSPIGDTGSNSTIGVLYYKSALMSSTFVPEYLALVKQKKRKKEERKKKRRKKRKG
jgi:hypothetical protein